MARRPAPLTFALAPTLGLDAHLQIARAEPLAAYLSQALDRHVQLMVASDYATCLESLRAGRIDAAMLGEVAALQAATEGGIDRLVLPVGADGQVPTYRSAIFTRIDFPIRDLQDVRGKRMGLVDEQSASGYRMPRAMLREAGLDPDRDVHLHLLGRHRLVVEAVLDGTLDVGASHAGTLRPPSLDRGPDYARLRVLALSRNIPRGPLVVRASLSPTTRRALLEALLSVHDRDPAAANVLNVARGERFSVATQSTPPTLKSIAQLAGVSYATVSRAINGSGNVSPETARRVQAIVDEIGYRPNGHALTLHGRAAPLVGVVQCVGASSGLQSIDDARRELSRAGVPLVLCPVDGRLAASPYLELLMDGRFGALVVGAEHAAEPEVVRVARTGRLVIGVDCEPQEPSIIRTPASALVETIVRCVTAPR